MPSKSQGKRQIAFVVIMDIPPDASLFQATMYVSDAVAKHRLSLQQYTPMIAFKDGDGKVQPDFPAKGNPMAALNPNSITVFRAEPVGKKPTVIPPSESDIAADIAARSR